MVILSSPLRRGQNHHNKKNSTKISFFKISIFHNSITQDLMKVRGVDYYFVSFEFEKLIDENEFYEYAKIFDNYYGTLKKV